MPQLAPINWLFLFFLFWGTVGICSSVVWWMFKPSYYFTIASASKALSKEATWKW
uniref:ATP synthase complex subunit 8 n=1 Tax=Anatoma sp. MNHN-IM-2013-42003 TaxID=2496594 RepID=A0A6B7FQG1_9VEST|nr:ATP synthase subunit 8 [Anatoma sp. MNHN-IM-2013-42003]